jgi:hypothetical protein
VSERRAGRLGWAALLLCLAGSAVSAQDSYPADIAPPPGTRYPCALTALPRELPGIPEADRAYINRTYARVLRATQTKLVLLKALEDGQGMSTAAARYREAVDGLRARQGADAVPSGLLAFQQDVLAALELQQGFFAKAVELRERGLSMSEAYQLQEGRQASARLVGAWSQMQARYPAWSAETRDSIYHHLCALDLF